MAGTALTPQGQPAPGCFPERPLAPRASRQALRSSSVGGAVLHVAGGPHEPWARLPARCPAPHTRPIGELLPQGTLARPCGLWPAAACPPEWRDAPDGCRAGCQEVPRWRHGAVWPSPRLAGSQAPGQAGPCGGCCRRPHGEALVSGTLAQESKRQRSPDAPKMLSYNEPTAHAPAARVLGGFSSGRGSRLRHGDPRVPAPGLQPELGLPGASRRKTFGASAGSPGTQPWWCVRCSHGQWPGSCALPSRPKTPGLVSELPSWGPAAAPPPPADAEGRPLQRSLLMEVGPRREGGRGVVRVGCRPVP